MLTVHVLGARSDDSPAPAPRDQSLAKAGRARPSAPIRTRRTGGKTLMERGALRRGEGRGEEGVAGSLLPPPLQLCPRPPPKPAPRNTDGLCVVACFVVCFCAYAWCHAHMRAFSSTHTPSPQNTTT
jgi:hypothetical protein